MWRNVLVAGKREGYNTMTTPGSMKGKESMTLHIWKLSGAGNDFVALDNRQESLPDGRERADLVRRLCARRLGVGADGALFIEASEEADFRMRYYNSDGGEAEMCGNGARCVARLAHLLGAAGETMRFHTGAGLCLARVLGDRVRVSMMPPANLREHVVLRLSGAGMTFPIREEWMAFFPDLAREGTVDFLNTGVPHLALLAEDLERAPVVEMGRALRNHPAFNPPGANVNFATPIGENRLAIRTYERGVEDETLACGTGCIATAILFARKGRVAPPVILKTQGGQELIVDFEPADTGAKNVTLEGEARIVFEGETRDLG